MAVGREAEILYHTFMVISIGYKLWLLIFIGLFSVTPFRVLAHGGVQQHVGDTHVTLIQKPLSPLINETVKLSFVVTGADDEPLRDFAVTMRILQTKASGDADEEIFSAQGMTDQNGVIEFEYVFAEERDYDVSLVFAGVASEAGHEIGFLVSPRDVRQPTGYPTSRVLMAMGIGVLIGIGIFQTARTLRQP